MKKRILSALAFCAGLVAILSSCIDGKNEVVAYDFAVVREGVSGMGISMGTSYFGLLAAPNLEGQFEDGDCILATSFTINYDNQPSSSYLTATKVTAQAVETQDETIYKTWDEYHDDDFKQNISAVGLYYSPYYYGRVFAEVQITHKANETFDMELICNPDSVSDNGVQTLYLRAKKTKVTETGADGVYYHRKAFNLRELILDKGEYVDDETGKGHCLNVIVRYQNGTVSEEDDTPVYKTVSSPIKLWVP